MVAPKRGRGANCQANQAAEEPAQEQAPEEVPEAENMEAEDNAGDAQEGDSEAAMEGDGGVTVEGDGEGVAEGDAQDKGESAQEAQENANGDTKPEEEKSDPNEQFKVIVENVPLTHLFDYKQKLRELFSKHGDIIRVIRGPIFVTELTKTPTVSAVVEFRKKESLEKALTENGTELDGNVLSVALDSKIDNAVLVGVPYELSMEYVRAIFDECGPVALMHEYRKTHFRTLRVIFETKEGCARAMKLDRELRINGFLVTVNKYMDDEQQKQNHIVGKMKREQAKMNRQSNQQAVPNTPPQQRNNNNNPRGRGGFNSRSNYRGNPFGGRGGGGRGGFPARGGSFPRGGFAPPINNYMPPAPFMQRPLQGGFMDGQRPNKRLRQL